MKLQIRIAEAADRLDLSPETIRRMIAAGVLRASGQGKLRRVLLADVEAYARGEIVWQAKNDGGRAAMAASTRTKTASGGRKSRSVAGVPDALVLKTDRTPKRNGKNS